MTATRRETRIRAVSILLCFSISFFAAGASAQQTEIPDELDVVGGNSSNSLMFWLSYSEEPGGIDQAVTLNTDANAYPSLNSFTFLRDTCGATSTDVVAASTNASQVVIYKDGRGAGQPICGATGQPACPPRPTALSSSTEQVIAVATSGAAGSTPGVFTFTPGSAPGEPCDQFSVQGGALSVGANKIRAITDSEFVRVDGNGLFEGDLLVLVSNPAMIVRVTPDSIAASASTGTVFADSLSFFANNHKKATPTGLAVVPGDNRNVLVTLSTGVIVNFYHDGSGWTSNPNNALDASNFPNPRGIAAGTRDDVPYIVVSEQNRGRYIRAELAGTGGGLSLAPPFREIVSPVGAPEGIAINNEDLSVSVTEDACFDVNPGDNESLEDTGCDILGAIQVHLSSYGDGQSPGDRITADLRLVEDTRAGSPLGPLDIGEGYFVPAACRGFLLDDGKRYVVLLEMGLNFEVGAANFIKVTEQVKDLLPGVGDCTEESTRIFHRPGDDPGELSDKTFYCSNPSRSIMETFSPVALCFDPLDRERRLVYGDPPDETNLQAAIETRRDEVNDEIRRRIESLKGIVDELRIIGDNVVDDPGFAALGDDLNTYITGRTNPNSSWPQIRYREASCSADKGALAVFYSKEPLFRDRSDLTPDKTLYARALSETLGLAFYISETGALVEHRPPWPLCDPGDLENPRPELPDVTCRPWPDPNPWCAD
jgi:hypothetical protein